VAQGLQCWDASGVLLVDVTDRLTRILGFYSMSAGSSGTITDAGFLTGSGFCIAVRTNNGGGDIFNNTMVAPDVSFSGSDLNYASRATTGDHLLIYGVY
jgi:hypothetical protein